MRREQQRVDYDALGDTYVTELERAVAFSGKDLDFFVELKARILLDLLARRLGPPGELETLQVGCGVGLIDRHLVGHLAGLTGIDVSSGALEQAAHRNPEARYELYDGGRAPFADGSFDAVFAVNLLQVLPPGERPGVVREMGRLARAGGLVVVFEHNPWNPLTRLVVRRCSFAVDVAMFPRREAIGMLAGAGLEPEESRYYAFFPWRGEPFRRLERRLGRVPLGAQYLVSGRHP